ncbi:MAG: hypothetical protein ACYDH3_02255 [Candidatus Aminicenantales bacterium]
MRLKFWLETPPSENRAESRPGRKTGASMMIVVFVYFMISVIGLGLYTLTRTYRLWSSAKNDAVLLSTAAENGARAGFAAVETILTGRTFPLVLTETGYAALRAATLSGQTDIVEAALGAALPLAVQDTDGESEWGAALDFEPEHVSDSESYFAAEFLGSIEARGKLARRLRTKRTVLNIGLAVMAGRVPLSAFPFLLAGENGPAQAAALLAENKVVLAPPEAGGGLLLPASTRNLLIPSDVSPQLAETLKIKVFSPDGLTVYQLRQALGLPLVNEPVPDGVYLVTNDAGLGGVFIQGDVEEMILAAAAGRQYFQFRLEEGTWRMWFNPSEYQTEFVGPKETRSYARSPLPIVMVNGDIDSLGGGVVDGLGNLILSTGTDAPSILAGVSLTIVSSGETVITSHLIQEGVRWSDGLPYIKDSTAQLFLYAAGSDFLTGAETGGRIRIGDAAPADLYLQASLTARNGIQIEGEGRKVTVSGGVQASDLKMGENRLFVLPDSRLLSTLQSPNVSPRSIDHLLLVIGWEARRWSE